MIRSILVLLLACSSVTSDSFAQIIARTRAGVEVELNADKTYKMRPIENFERTNNEGAVEHLHTSGKFTFTYDTAVWIPPIDANPAKLEMMSKSGRVLITMYYEARTYDPAKYRHYLLDKWRKANETILEDRYISINGNAVMSLKTRETTRTDDLAAEYWDILTFGKDLFLRVIAEGTANAMAAQKDDIEKLRNSFTLSVPRIPVLSVDDDGLIAKTVADDRDILLSHSTWDYHTPAAIKNAKSNTKLLKAKQSGASLFYDPKKWKLRENKIDGSTYELIHVSEFVQAVFTEQASLEPYQLIAYTHAKDPRFTIAGEKDIMLNGTRGMYYTYAANPGAGFSNSIGQAHLVASNGVLNSVDVSALEEQYLTKYEADIRALLSGLKAE